MGAVAGRATARKRRRSGSLVVIFLRNEITTVIIVEMDDVFQRRIIRIRIVRRIVAVGLEFVRLLLIFGNLYNLHRFR